MRLSRSNSTRSTTPSSLLLLLHLSIFLLLSLTLTPSLTTGQTPNCEICIRRAIPTVQECTSLTTTQLATVEKAIYAHKITTASTSEYKTQDPQGFACLSGLMWDSVHYKAQLWKTCLDPRSACNWSEMMAYLTIIPRMAAIYGAKPVPPQVLVDAPA